MSALERCQRLLFIRTDRLGETLLNLPAAAALKAACPHATLTLLAHPDLKELLAGLPWIDQVLPYPPRGARTWWSRSWSLARTLRARRFDAAIISNPMKELHVGAWLAGIPVRVGYDRKWGGLLTHRLADRKALGERHEVEYNFDLIRRLGLPGSIPRVEPPRVEREHAEVLQLLEQQGIRPSEPFVAVHPWTSNPLKRWPLERFQALIRLIRTQLSVPVVVVGGPAERSQVAGVLSPEAGAIDLVGRLSLRRLAALLQQAKTLVSNDSGPAHLAALMRTGTVVLFGTTDPAASPRRWGPWGSGHAVIWKPAMASIAVDDVLRAVQGQLADASSRHP